MRKIGVGFVVFLMFFISSVCFSQEAASPPLSFKISADKKEYTVGPNIVIKTELTNTSKEPYYLNTWIFHHPQDLKAIVKGPNGIIEETIFVEYNYKMNEKSDYILLEPGKSYSNVLRSTSSPCHFLGHEIKDPGKYSVSVIYENSADYYWDQNEQRMLTMPNVWKGSVASNTMDIVIRGSIIDIKVKEVCKEFIQEAFKEVSGLKYEELESFEASAIAEDALSLKFLVENQAYVYSLIIFIEKKGELNKSGLLSYLPFYSKDFPCLGLQIKAFEYKLYLQDRDSTKAGFTDELRKVLDKSANRLQELEDKCKF